MVVITGMQGEPAAAETSVTLQQPEACHVFYRGSCPWITGPWQWRAAQALGGSLGSDLCLHTGFLVAAAAALVVLPVSDVRAVSCSLCPSLDLT